MAGGTIPFAVAAWGFASALAIAVLGAVSLVGGKSRPRGAAAFGLFAILWGIQIALGHAANLVTDADTAAILYGLVLALLVPLPFFLTEFALAQVGPAARGWRVARWLAVGTGIVSGIVLLLEPSLLYQGVFTFGTRQLPRWGPLHAWLVSLPFFLGFALALAALAKAKRASPTPRTAWRASVLLAGLGTSVSFTAGNNLAFYAQTWLVGGALIVPFVLVFLALTLVTLAIALRGYVDARALPIGPQRRHEMLVVAALVVPLVYGAIEGVLAVEVFPRLETVGLWRLAGVAILVYGIALWRTYDLPQRATRAAATVTGTGAAVATGAAAYGAGSVAASGALLPALAGVIVLSAALLPSINFARRLFGVPRPGEGRDLESALYGQRIDSYRAALEASLARNTFDEDQPFLAGLRERFRITPDEDRLLLHLARASVIISRDARAWDAYERLRLLGEGGGGRTWLARDRARDRLVVLKEPLERWQQDPSAREMVLREARLAAKVRHPNVVAVEEVVEGKGSPVIVMEYMEGGSLRDVMRAKGTLSWPQAKALALDLLRGIEAIQAGGIVHRDVKPSNILLDGDGVAKVADFGIAVSPATSGERTMIVDPGHSTIAGTLHYMAPEARRGAPPDKRADVYGCAAVLHEMLYGAPPGLLSPIVVRDDLPSSIPKVLANALAEDPQARTPTARAFAEALSGL
jgi:hypothetical protein